MKSLVEELGGIKEQITENHSSERLFKAVDATLYESISILLEHTYLIDEVLGIYFNTPTRKKISNAESEELAELIYHFYNGSTETRLDVLRKAKINRELLTLPVQMVAGKADSYCRALVNGTMETWMIRNELMLRNPDQDIALMLIQVKQWFDNYLELREAIIEKYYRLIVKDIGKYVHVIGGKLDKNDMATEYITSLLRAFSKFDTTAGAFTSYLQRWFKNARATSLTTDELGIAYTLPHSVRTKIGQGKGYSEVFNFSVEQADDASQDMRPELEDMDEDRAFNIIVHAADPKGYYRLLTEMEMDIQDFILPQNKTRLLTSR